MIDEESNEIFGYYIYLKNLQGDIIGLINYQGELECTYSYDAWGKFLGAYDEDGNDITNPYSAALRNPLRYRGYYYDTETGLYYLNSRYYNPEWGRFICADDVYLVGTNNGCSADNLYVYCGNNPVVRRDADGCYWETIVDIGFIGMDVYNLATDNGWRSWKNWAALGVDLLFTAVPFATGGGQIFKAGDIINDITKVTVVGETMDRVKDFARSVNAIDNLYGGFKNYAKLSDVGFLGKILAEVYGKTDNALWLYKKLRTGYTVVDIGIDVSRSTRSSSYMLETIVMTTWKAKGVLKVVARMLMGV